MFISYVYVKIIRFSSTNGHCIIALQSSGVQKDEKNNNPNQQVDFQDKELEYLDNNQDIVSSPYITLEHSFISENKTNFSQTDYKGNTMNFDSDSKISYRQDNSFSTKKVLNID